MRQEQVVKAIKRMVGDYRQKDWCEIWNVNQTVLSDVLRGHKPPTEQLCKMVGVERVQTVVYRKIGEPK